MKDKEKHIEEMAKVMCGGCYDGKECIHGLCADWYKAEKLYNADYRKTPKDSVVLSREEYNLLINIKKFFETADSEISAGNLLVYLKEFKEEASKETAEKFLKPLYDACKEDTYGQVIVDFTILENFAKQFGVEIKE